MNHAKEPHAERHLYLHQLFMELLDDWKLHTGYDPKMHTVQSLIDWSAEECQHPTPYQD